MSEPFVAEIRIFAGNFAPNGWALCDGQLLPISQNTALFSLLGTTYGGDGRSNFALPNLQGSAPLQAGQGPGLSNHLLGESGGSPAVSLLLSAMPSHTHDARAFAAAKGDKTDPSGHFWSKAQYGRLGMSMYSPTGPQQMNAAALSATGGGQPHNNLMPYLTLTFIIALQGVFPARP